MPRNTDRVNGADDLLERERQGATLSEFRKLRGLKLGELANELGVSYAYLSNIEAGRRRLTPQLIAKAAEVLAIPQVALVHPGRFEQKAAS